MYVFMIYKPNIFLLSPHVKSEAEVLKCVKDKFDKKAMQMSLCNFVMYGNILSNMS